MIVNKENRKIVCTCFAPGRKHDFRLYKESKTRIHTETLAETDTGYIGIKRFHANSILPKKRKRKQKLSKEDKIFNRNVSSERATNEHAIGFVKRFKILSERYRNRRRRFGLRFNLIAGICNFELAS